jgi:hypothetical protein
LAHSFRAAQSAAQASLALPGPWVRLAPQDAAAVAAVAGAAPAGAAELQPEAAARAGVAGLQREVAAAQDAAAVARRRVAAAQDAAAVAQLRVAAVRDAAAALLRVAAVPGARGPQRAVRPSAVALACRRDRVLPWPVPRLLAQFARAMQRLRIASP